MSDFIVELMDVAEDGLAAAWLARPDRAAVVRAEADAFAALSTDPIGRSEPLSEGLRRLVVGPLVYTFEVDTARRRVSVQAVGHFR